MIKAVSVFFVVWILVTAVITCFRALSGSEKWSVIKTLSYAGATAAVALLLLEVIVILF